jgi:hypothetical protein
MLRIIALPLLMFFQQGHMTMTSIEQVPGTDSLMMVVRLGNDLFLRDYQQTVNDDIGLEVLRKYRPFPTDMANNYINSKVTVHVNGRLLLGKILRLEAADGDIILNILYRLKKTPDNITVRNNILTGLFPDSENLTIIRIRNLETGIKFTREHNEATFNVR